MVKVLDFYASWCYPCKVLSPILDEIEKELNIDIEKINVEDNDEYVEYYDIKSVPTLILIKDGIVEDRINGLVPKEKLVEWIKKKIS